MIKVQCDRCGGNMDHRGLVGYISWCFKEGVDGDLGVNDLEGNHYCERCMDEIRAFINFPANWGPGANEPEAEQKGQKAYKKTDNLQKKVKKCSEKPENSSGKRSVRRITQSEAEAIIDLKKAGLSIKEIASALDLMPVQVKNWLYNHKKAVK